MTEAVLWLVLWALFACVGSWLIYVVFTVGGIGLAAATEKMWIAGLGIVLACSLTAAWLVFAVVQTILQIIAVVQLVAAG